MKKIFLVLAMLMLAAPVLAGVTVTAARVGTAVPAVVQVSYAMDGGDANIPRAFALDVNMSPANATALNPTSTNTNFYVALGGTTVDGNTVTWGAQFVNKTVNGFTTEMGSLWATNDPCGHTVRPLSSGTLFQFTVDKSCTITLAENALRGGVDSNGVVMEDTTKTFPKSYAKLIGTTVTLGSASVLSGTITLQNLTDPVGGPVGKTLTIQIYASGGSTVLETLSTTLGASGAYSGVTSALPPGTYDVCVKVSHWLRKKVAGKVFASPVTVDASLINGDVDFNNAINATDMGGLKTNYGKSGSGWAGDLNEDGAVNATDMGLLKTNYGKTGD